MTKEEKRKEQIKELTDKLEKGVQDVYTSEKYIEYLRFCARFHDYSWRNNILIIAQCPTASHVAGYQTWQKQFKRHVKKGEKAIRILAPSTITITETDADGNEQKRKIIKGFHPTCVFDVSQTDGEPIPEFISELKDGDDKKNIGLVKSALLDISPAKDIVFAAADEMHGAFGYYQIDENIIVIKKDLSTVQTIKTMIHETAHSILHRTGGKSEKVSRSEMELQAESIAFIVSDFLGIDTGDYSFPYIASWAKDKDGKSLAENLEVIGKTAKNMIDALEILTVKVKQVEEE